MSHLTEVFGGDVVVFAAGHPMNERQHLIFSLDELSLVRAGNDRDGRELIETAEAEQEAVFFIIPPPPHRGHTTDHTTPDRQRTNPISTPYPFPLPHPLVLKE